VDGECTALTRRGKWSKIKEAQDQDRKFEHALAAAHDVGSFTGAQEYILTLIGNLGALSHMLNKLLFYRDQYEIWKWRYRKSILNSRN
jgi:hypothetical protein